ncbi:MAG: alpha-L-fucosidase [Caldilinea sp.]
MAVSDNPNSEKIRWFTNARFGMFIHWGLYALLGRGEWARYTEAIPPDEYHALAQQFQPRHFDATAWARLAKAAGMKYMVLTAKHHDGFCLFDSQYTDFTSVKSAAKRDFVAEYVAACRAEGLGVGLYFTVKDWEFPAYFDGPERNPQGWAALVDHFHNQTKELLTNYGKIDILWFDCPDDANFRGGWGEQTPDVWRSQELGAWIEEAQPGILINNRGGLPGDFRTPEQTIPHGSQPGVFESCVTMTHKHWGYCPDDPYKDVWRILDELISCVAVGGNYLLNVGPDPDGVIPLPACARLLEIGRWLETHGEAIYGTERLLPDWWDHTSTGRITTKDNIAYLIVQLWSPTGSISLNQLQNDVRRATLLATGQTLTVRREGRRLLIEGLPPLPPALPFNVVKLELDGPAAAQFYY